MWRPLLAALALAAASCAPAEDDPGSDPGAGAGDAPELAPREAPDGVAASGVAETDAPESGAGGQRGEAPAPPDALSRAPARTKLGRIRSVVVESEVVFVGLEQQPHAMTLTCAFPKRTRMELAGPGGAQVRYQLGERIWSLDRGGAASPVSREFLEPDRSAVALDLALRRALFFWPDEGEFIGGGRTLSAQVDDFGVLVATLEVGGTRPVEMRAFASNGSVVGRLAVDEWFEQGGREWPRRLRLLSGDEVLWHETVEQIDADWFVGDPTFVPPDVLLSSDGRGIEEARALELPRRSEARVPVEAGVELAAAVDRAVAAWSGARRDAELELAPHVDVVVDRRGAPAAIVLTATGASGEVAGARWGAAAPAAAWRIAAPEGPGVDYEATAGSVSRAATAGAEGPVELRHRVILAAVSDGESPPRRREAWILAVVP